jgi:hypothetical protein
MLLPLKAIADNKSVKNAPTLCLFADPPVSNRRSRDFKILIPVFVEGRTRRTENQVILFSDPTNDEY